MNKYTQANEDYRKVNLVLDSYYLSYKLACKEYVLYEGLNEYKLLFYKEQKNTLKLIIESLFTLSEMFLCNCFFYDKDYDDGRLHMGSFCNTLYDRNELLKKLSKIVELQKI
jgi:hypothetical protein